ncbi:RNA-guided endonuclease TnpB family protein [Phormidium nigroviride]
MAKARSKTPKKPKVPLGVQQNLISADQELKSVLEFICSESNKLYNCATYYARQIWFKSYKYVTSFDIVRNLTKNVHFSALPSDAATQTCISVGESISSFAKLRELWRNGELEDKLKPPNYRKPGYQLVAYPKRALRLIDGQIRFPLGLRVNAWFGLKEFFLPMPSNLDFDSLREVRILPRNGCFYAEFVYPVVVEQPVLDPAKCLGLELYGIRFEETEESYTSKASFLDADTIPTYGEKPLCWKASGKRVKRGLYRSSQGVEINADCNGAANILRKVAVKLRLDLSGISSGDLNAPLKLKFWAVQESQRL